MYKIKSDFRLAGGRGEEMEYRIIRLSEQPEIKERAAQWFHEKWQIPLEAYLESMEESVRWKEETR